MKLYNFDLSGNCYKVRLLLALLGRAHEVADVDLLGGENRRPAFLALNPLGQVPVLQDGPLTLRDSQAILLYLAHGTPWLPGDGSGLGQVGSWLSLAANEIANGPAALRSIKKFGRQRDPGAACQLADTVFAVLEQRLTGNDWLVGERATIADLACYPYLALAPDGDYSPEPFPGVCAWFERIERLPGYVPMPGLFAREVRL